MNPFEMVIGIVLIVMIASVLKTRYRAKHGIIADEDGNEKMIGSHHAPQDTSRLKDEIDALKERIQVLERIATDNNSANDINRQIEQLRDR